MTATSAAASSTSAQGGDAGTGGAATHEPALSTKPGLHEKVTVSDGALSDGPHAAAVSFTNKTERPSPSATNAIPR